MPLTWAEIFELFGAALAAALVAAAVCPPVGCFLLVRRTGFYGIALPQFAAAGVACGFAVLHWTELLGVDGEAVLSGGSQALRYHLIWALIFTFGALLLLASQRSNSAAETAGVAAAFAVASALTTLFAHASPTGDVFVHELLRGEILAVGRTELGLMVLVYGLAAVVLALLQPDLLVVSFDPEMASVLGKRVLGHTLVLQGLTGAVIATGVMVVGPVVLFGLLVLPPLAARALARSWKSFVWIAAGLGLVSAVAGIWMSFRFDWPLGPSVVVAAACTLVAKWIPVGSRSEAAAP